MYKVIKRAISKELAEFCYDYFLNKRKLQEFFMTVNIFLNLMKIGEYGMTHKFPKHIVIMAI